MASSNMGANPGDNYHSSDKSEQDLSKLKEVDLEDQGVHRVTGLDDSSSEESVGRQIAMESDNSIKYRSCSWQKVRYPHPA